MAQGSAGPPMDPWISMTPMLSHMSNGPTSRAGRVLCVSRRLSWPTGSWAARGLLGVPRHSTEPPGSGRTWDATGDIQSHISGLPFAIGMILSPRIRNS